MDEKSHLDGMTIPLSQYSGGVAKGYDPYDFGIVAAGSSAAFATALQNMSKSVAQAAASMRMMPWITHVPVIWDSAKMDIESDAVRPKPKRIDPRGFGEVEL